MQKVSHAPLLQFPLSDKNRELTLDKELENDPRPFLPMLDFRFDPFTVLKSRP